MFKIVQLGKNSAQLQLSAIPDFNVIHKFEVKSFQFKSYYCYLRLTILFYFQIIITATDGGKPRQKSTPQKQIIIFVSTNGPEFETNTFTAWFHENTTGLDEFQIIPQAHDMINEGGEDDMNIDIYYFLASGGIRSLKLRFLNFLNPLKKFIRR